MIGWILRRVNADRPTAVRTIGRGCHLDEGVVFGRRGAEPAGMTLRSAPLARLALGRAAEGWLGAAPACRWRLVANLFCRSSLSSSFRRSTSRFERFVLGHQIRDRFPRGVQLTMQLVLAVTTLVGQMDQSPQRCAAQMRAMAELRASEFVLGIKAEAHGRSSLNAENLANFTRPGQPNSLHPWSTGALAE